MIFGFLKAIFSNQHIQELTKDIKSADIKKPIGNAVDICQTIGFSNEEIKNIFDPQEIFY